MASLIDRVNVLILWQLEHTKSHFSISISVALYDFTLDTSHSFLPLTWSKSIT